MSLTSPLGEMLAQPAIPKGPKKKGPLDSGGGPQPDPTGPGLGGWRVIPTPDPGSRQRPRTEQAAAGMDGGLEDHTQPGTRDEIKCMKQSKTKHWNPLASLWLHRPSSCAAGLAGTLLTKPSRVGNIEWTVSSNRTEHFLEFSYVSRFQFP